MTAPFEIFLQGPPGLEPQLRDEAVAAGFTHAEAIAGGVRFKGHWTSVWRANLMLRGPSRVLARIGHFRVMHLSQLDRRARGFNWGEVLNADVPVRIEVSTVRRNRIYHEGAAKERIARAITEEFGALVTDEPASEDNITVLARIEHDVMTLSVDTSGALLHKRGHKPAVGKAPMRETLAALFLRAAGYDGREPVIDPMCGSGTFLLEAAEMAAGLWPGRNRRFAFEKLATFNADLYDRIRAEAPAPATDLPAFLGADRDAGAVERAERNAEATGLAKSIRFLNQPLSALERPDGPPGLVIMNPPYGARIGDKRQLYALYGSIGRVMAERFSGWRVGIITSDAQLAQSSKLPFSEPGPNVPHGGLRVKLYQTQPLP